MRAENLLAETHISLATIKRQHEALGDFTANSVVAMHSRQRPNEDSASSPDSQLRNDRHDKSILQEVTKNTFTKYDSL